MNGKRSSRLEMGFAELKSSFLFQSTTTN